MKNKHLKLNFLENGYLLDDEPYLENKFIKAMSFHYPESLAAVRDTSGAFHIHLDGSPLYVERYEETFGFYNSIATVKNKSRYYHIDIQGKRIHAKSFLWSGNFQEGLCAVCDEAGFFHVDVKGDAIYSDRFEYVGDFKYNIAVVRKQEKVWHIQRDGQSLHKHQFLDAGVYHKGFATAKDSRGWFHVDKYGEQLYSHRFSAVEPFYNGVALCETNDGFKVRLQENGHYRYLFPSMPLMNTQEFLRRYKSGEQLILITRHADRDRIPSKEWGMEVDLNGAGKQHARLLGQALKDVSFKFLSSPVQRCLTTCVMVADGMKVSLPQADIETSVLLGDPGAFADLNAPSKEILPSSFAEIAERYVHIGTEPGFHPLVLGCTNMINLLVDASLQHKQPLFVSTHDLFVAGLLSFFGLRHPTREHWVEFLEGICFIVKDGHIEEWRGFYGLSKEGLLC